MPILYSVTCTVAADEAAEWLDWMLREHIPQVMATGCFTGFRTARLLAPVEDDSQACYNTTYVAATRADYERYRAEFAPALQAETAARYGERVLAFRSLLEEVAPLPTQA